jgi:pimeloyl-ACP methyl ester carboxylesterase
VQELLAAAERGHLDVDGCPIAWARWAPSSAVGRGVPIALVHGAGAHLGWWEAVIGPLRAAGHDVLALELSGHGASAHRQHYGAGVWAREVLAVLRRLADGPVLLVGHSLGGRVAVCAAAADPALAPRLVLIDAPVRQPGAIRSKPRALRSRPLPRHVHPTLEQAIATFRLRPREPVADEALLRRVAAAAFVEHGDGWALRADLAVFARIPDTVLAAALGRYPGPITLVHGTYSTVTDADGLAFLAEAHGGPTEVVAVEGHHHLTLDQGAEVAAHIAERWALI